MLLKRGSIVGRHIWINTTLGMKAHIGLDVDSGLMHTATTTAANEADVEQVADLLHGKEKFVYADFGYRGASSAWSGAVQGFKGLQKNTAQLLTLFALSNLWMAAGS